MVGRGVRPAHERRLYRAPPTATNDRDILLLSVLGVPFRFGAWIISAVDCVFGAVIRFARGARRCSVPDGLDRVVDDKHVPRVLHDHVIITPRQAARCRVFVPSQILEIGRGGCNVRVCEVRFARPFPIQMRLIAGIHHFNLKNDWRRTRIDARTFHIRKRYPENSL
jgi:hypothetical protein